MVFKSGTCLRKCFFEDYRFSEDLDFSSLATNFNFDAKILKKIIEEIKNEIGVQIFYEPIKTLQHNNIQKGFQVNIKYWEANHSKNQRPLPPQRWHTKIKLEVSTEEIILLPTSKKQIFHKINSTS